MKSPLIARRTNFARGFTLVELMVAIGLFSILSVGAFSVLRSGLLLSSTNLGINVSAFRGRQLLDQINEKTRYALFQPTLIDATGADVSASTGDGVIIKDFIGSPYVVKEVGGTMGDIASTAKQFVVEFRNTLPPPLVGDYILMETVSRPELEISAVATMAASGSVQRRLITTTTAIGELARPSGYRVSGLLYRQEAFVFVNTETGANPRASLRHYSRVTNATNFSDSASYSVMGVGFRRLSGQAYFTVGTSNGAPMISLAALANSSDRQEYVSGKQAASTFTSVPIHGILWAINR